MRDAELIIAINTDENAPIFDVAHYGTTEDLLRRAAGADGEARGRGGRRLIRDVDGARGSLRPARRRARSSRTSRRGRRRSSTSSRSISTGIFLAGFGRRVRKYLRGRRDAPLRPAAAPGRPRAVARSTRRRRSGAGNTAVGVFHGAVLWGFTALFIGTVILAVDVEIVRLFFGEEHSFFEGPFYLDLLRPARRARAGLRRRHRRARRSAGAASRRRSTTRAPSSPSEGYCRSEFSKGDWLFVGLLLVLGLTGFLGEGLRIRANEFPDIEEWSPVGWVGRPRAIEGVGIGAGAASDLQFANWWFHALIALGVRRLHPVLQGDAHGARLRQPRVPRRSWRRGACRAAAGHAGGRRRNGARRCDPARLRGADGLHLEGAAEPRRLHQVRALPQRLPGARLRCPALAARPDPRPAPVGRRRTRASRRCARLRAAARPHRPAGAAADAGRGRRDHGGDAVGVHDVHGLRRGLPGRDRARADDRAACAARLVDEGRVEPMLQQTLQNFAQQGNSYGKSSRMRARWTKGAGLQDPRRAQGARRVPLVRRRLRLVRRALAGGLPARRAHPRTAPASRSACSTTGERNAGNDVRRVGEEGLFEMLVEQNIAAFAEASFERIFTTDPHSLNTLRNEYPEFGEMKPVQHYTELLVRAARRAAVLASTSRCGPRDLPRPVLPGALQPRHRRAAAADRRHRRRARRDAAQRRRHVLLRRRRRAHLDGRLGADRAPERAAHQGGAGARRARLLRRHLPEGPRDVLRRRQDASAPTSRSSRSRRCSSARSAPEPAAVRAGRQAEEAAA